MTLELKHFSISDEGEKRFAEATFASDSSDEPEELLTFRVQVDAEGYPRLPEAQLEALQRARNAIGAQERQIEDIRSRVYPGEDWRK